LHAPLPLEELKHVPQPVVSLIKSLLDKDPARRPQSPSELLSLLHEVRVVLEAKAQVEFRGVLREAAEPKRGEALHDAGDRMETAVQTSALGESRARNAGLLTEPCNFTPFLVAKLKGFTGRQWLFQEINDWLAKGSQPALLIIGEPGIGKSSIVAALVRENPGGQLLAHHCCRADTPATLDPSRFVGDLSVRLSAELSEYAAMLSDPLIVNALQFADADPASAFENAVLNPLHKIREPGHQGRRYLLIDALDEAMARTQKPTTGLE
jgi:AAA ATPase domain